MMLQPNPFSDSRVCVKCTRCDAPVHPGAGDSFLAMVGHILKLRCGECSFEDWYLESEFFLLTDYSREFRGTDALPQMST
jgi:hypothetical protein